MTFNDDLEKYEQLLALRSSVRVQNISGMQEAISVKLNERRIPMMSDQLERILSGEMYLRFPTGTVREQGTGLCEAG